MAVDGYYSACWEMFFFCVCKRTNSPVIITIITSHICFTQPSLLPHPVSLLQLLPSSLFFSLLSWFVLLLYKQWRWYELWSIWSSSSWWCRWPSGEQIPCTCSRKPSSWGTSGSSRRCSGPSAPDGLWRKPPWPILLRYTVGWWEKRGSNQHGGHASKRWLTLSIQPCHNVRKETKQSWRLWWSIKEHFNHNAVERSNVHARTWERTLWKGHWGRYSGEATTAPSCSSSACHAEPWRRNLCYNSQCSG